MVNCTILKTIFLIGNTVCTVAAAAYMLHEVFSSDEDMIQTVLMNTYTIHTF